MTTPKGFHTKAQGKRSATLGNVTIWFPTLKA